MSAPLLEIVDLHVNVGERPILRGLDLVVGGGEVHAIMGPNGSGKSTLANVIAGRAGYEVVRGDVRLDGESILELEPEIRARMGVFLAFQYPTEIPGVSNLEFLRQSVDAVRAHRGEPALGAADLLRSAREIAAGLELSADALKRGVNEGFSGGEKKRNEILQMRLLEPRLAVLDETDSGLDIDALRIVADGVNGMQDAHRGFVLVTHYQRLLDYIVPDHVHVLAGGRIVRSGDRTLARELEKRGYGWLTDGAAA